MAKVLSTFRILSVAVFSTWISRIINIVCAIITLPILISHLGKTEFGIWVIVGQTVSFLSLPDLGTTTSIGRILARFRGLNDEKSIKQLISTSTLILCLAGLLTLIIVLLVSPWIPMLLAIKGKYINITRLVFLISGVSFAIQFPLRIGMGILAGHQLYGLHAIGKISRNIIFPIGIIVLVGFNSFSLLSLFIINEIANLSAQIILIIVASKVTKIWTINLRNASLGMAKEILSIGISNISMTFSNLIFRKGTGIIIGRMLGLEAAGVFGVASTIIDSIVPFISAAATPFTTLASEWKSQNKLNHLRKTSDTIMRITAGFAASISAGIFIYGQAALRLWLSEGKWSSVDFAEACASMSIMGLGIVFGLPQIISSSILIGIGKHWQVSTYFAVSILISLFTSIVAMQSGFGIIGGALGWGLCQVLQGVFYLFLICNYMKISILQTLLNIYPRGIATGMVVLLLAYGFQKIFTPDNFINLLIGVIPCALLGCLIVILFSGKSNLILSRIINKF